MADKSHTSRHSAAAVSDPAAIRNVVLVGPSGAGKTTLVQTLLGGHGAALDNDRPRSVSLTLASLCHDGVKINLIDTPGYADFVGELRAGLRAADCALFVIAANEHLDEPTRGLWQECDDIDMPRAVVITKLDHPRANFPAALAAAQAAFGDTVLPLAEPAPDGATLVDLLETRQGALIEAIIEGSEDESLMERYLDGAEVDSAVLLTDLEQAVARAAFFPVLPVSATGLGAPALLDTIVKGFPSPPEHRLPEVFTATGRARDDLRCDPDGPLLAEVVHTTSDPYVGRISLARVFSGTLRSDATVHVSGRAEGHPEHDEDERVGTLACPQGSQPQPTPRVSAGDIGMIGKLSRAETGDTLSDTGDPLVLKPWNPPDPLLPTAIVAQAKSDEDKLAGALARLAAEDPTVRIEQNPETHQIVLWCMGEAHTAVVLEALRSRFGVGIDTEELRIPLRETFAGTATGHGRYVKQSGGHGQFAVCDIDVEPLPQGSGFEFVDRVVGGAVPRQFIGSVEKGVRAQMAKGLHTDTGPSHPVVDIRVTLRDGKAHSVDSSDFAFQMAGALALRDAAAAARLSVLEPIDAVTVQIPDGLVGAVMGDLSARRSRVLGTDNVDGGRTEVRAEIPQTELTRYPTDLRSLSHGAATLHRAFARYEPVSSR